MKTDFNDQPPIVTGDAVLVPSEVETEPVSNSRIVAVHVEENPGPEAIVNGSGALNGVPGVLSEQLPTPDPTLEGERATTGLSVSQPVTPK